MSGMIRAEKKPVDCLARLGKKTLCPIAPVQYTPEPLAITIDSGAGESVMPADCCESYEIMSGEMTGEEYEAAQGGIITNVGQRDIVFDTKEGTTRGFHFEVGDSINKPLGSVGRITDKGNRVVFEQDCGYIESLKTGERTWFDRRDDVYVLDALVRPATPSFRRQS